MEDPSKQDLNKNYNWRGIRQYYHEREAVLFAARLRGLGFPVSISNHRVADPLPLTNSNYEIRVPLDFSAEAQDILTRMEAEVDNFCPAAEAYRDISKEEIYYLQKANSTGFTPLRGVIIFLILLLISLIIRAIVTGATSILF